MLTRCRYRIHEMSYYDEISDLSGGPWMRRQDQQAAVKTAGFAWPSSGVCKRSARDPTIYYQPSSLDLARHRTGGVVGPSGGERVPASRCDSGDPAALQSLESTRCVTTTALNVYSSRSETARHVQYLIHTYIQVYYLVGKKQHITRVKIVKIG